MELRDPDDVPLVVYDNSSSKLWARPLGMQSEFTTITSSLTALLSTLVRPEGYATGGEREFDIQCIGSHQSHWTTPDSDKTETRRAYIKHT